MYLNFAYLNEIFYHYFVRYLNFNLCSTHFPFFTQCGYRLVQGQTEYAAKLVKIIKYGAEGCTVAYVPCCFYRCWLHCCLLGPWKQSYHQYPEPMHNSSEKGKYVYTIILYIIKSFTSYKYLEYNKLRLGPTRILL
jgi:hypothetical protein